MAWALSYLAQAMLCSLSYVRLVSSLRSSTGTAFLEIKTTTTAAAAAAAAAATVLRPFVRDYPGGLVPEETFTHSNLS